MTFKQALTLDAVKSLSDTTPTRARLHEITKACCEINGEELNQMIRIVESKINFTIKL